MGARGRDFLLGIRRGQPAGAQVQRWCSWHECTDGRSRQAGSHGQLTPALIVPFLDTGAVISGGFAMSLHPQHPIPSVPEQTARIARAAFPKGSPYLTLRDTLGTIFVDGHFADLYPKQGQPACPPWRLALITLMQFREGLSDRQAAEAVRARIDWKYLLGLELSDPGFDFSVLCEFRDRLLAGGAQERLLERVLEVARELGVLKARGLLTWSSNRGSLCKALLSGRGRTCAGFRVVFAVGTRPLHDGSSRG